MFRRSATLIAGFGLALCAHFPSVSSAGVGQENGAPVRRDPLVFVSGPDAQAIHFPRDEQLEYGVSIDLGLLGSARVGGVVMSAQVVPLEEDQATRAPSDAVREQALVSARARGEYQVYTLDETIRTRFQPLDWPRFQHETVQRGTENRRRELTIGVRAGEGVASYRSDGHCKGCEDDAHFVDPTFFWNSRKHCKSCKAGEHRVWRDAKEKKIPADALDMVSAVMLARTVVQQGKPGAKFTMLDRDRLWEVEISRGRRERHRVSAGTFDLVEVLLVTRPPEGEVGRSADFQGLFGLKGNISIWMHPESGVPVEISGRLPAGIVELDVRIELEKFSGTPESFRRVIK